VFIDGAIIIKTPNLVDSVGAKNTWEGKPYFVACYHQLSNQSRILHNGTFYDLPTDMGNYVRPFLEKDIALLPWTWFNGKCPTIRNVLPLIDFDHHKNSACPITFCAVDPTSKSKMVTGASGVRYTADRIYYNNDTASGYCGSWVIASYDGKHFRVGIHSGTKGGGTAPNYCYRFNPDPSCRDFQK